jgi:DNA adenine methylase
LGVATVELRKTVNRQCQSGGGINMTVKKIGNDKIDPFLKWAGGKRWLIKNDRPIKPSKFNRYLEPFIGGGAVFFSLPHIPHVISDLNAELINCYLSIRDNWQNVQKLLERHQRNHSDEYYYKIRKSQPRSEVIKAARLIYLNRTCWNGLYRVNLAGKFNVPRGTKNKVLLSTDNFESVSQKLGNGLILCQDFEATINMANEGDFVFVDPPYTVAHNLNAFVKYNEKIFSWGDQVRLKDSILRAVSRGAMITLTNADHKSVRKLYDGTCSIEQVSRYSVIAGKSRYRGKANELLMRFGWE